MFHEVRFARFNAHDLEAPTHVRFHRNLRGHESTWQRWRGYRAFARSSVSENEDWSLEIRLASESPAFPQFGRRQRTFSYRIRLARVRMEIAKLVFAALVSIETHRAADRVHLFSFWLLRHVKRSRMLQTSDLFLVSTQTKCCDKSLRKKFISYFKYFEYKKVIIWTNF